jgi:hypothetical protein
MESLRDFEKIFKFKVLERSADLDVSLSLSRDMSLPLISNESASGRLVIKSSLPVKNIFVICSYSHIFGFQTKCLENPDDLSLDLNLRATKIGDLNIKFLVRYEVVGATNSVSKFRFKRIELNLHVKERFHFKPSFHVSKKVSGQYNTQLVTQMVDKMFDRQMASLGQPKVTSISIMQRRPAMWQILKKTETPSFFILQHEEPHQEEELVN